MSRRDIPFCKAHGLGNDFLLIERRALGGADPGALARRMCDRHSGAGADGLVVLGEAVGVEASFRIYNADGSEAGVSGNGVRCAAAWLISRRSSTVEQVTLDTKVGRKNLFCLGRDTSGYHFRTEIGQPSFRAAEIPFAPPHPVREPVVAYPLPLGDATIPVTILSMGNPQCIYLLAEWETVNWPAWGEEMESHPYFPERANIGFVRVLDDSRIEARFWERGAGHTLASGTGSCACAVAAHLSGKTGRRVTVAVERGELHVYWRDDGMVELTGPAEIVAEGVYHDTE